MKLIKKIFMLGMIISSIVLLTACQGGDNGDKDPERIVQFTYQTPSFTPLIGASTYQSGANESVTNFDEVIINPVIGARDDFIKGVDASMIDKIEKLGGKYFNEDGQEQDVFQILADHGVNFFRVRVWNRPRTVTMQEYGGGAVDVAKAIDMAKRAQAVGMNIFVNFHYSDIWADPEFQITPRDWGSKTKNELPGEVEKYTYDSLIRFKNAGVNVHMVQIGNEINYGMFYDKSGKIDWSSTETEIESFDFITDVLKAGIKGAREAFDNIFTVIHLANGATYSEFDAYMSHMERKNVDYDIIAASYYPYYDGGIEGLKHNLNTISEQYNKHVLIAETAYAHSDVQTHPFSQNIYTAAQFEDRGGFVTSIQGQASMLRDVMQAVAEVPSQKGLGVFYFEPGWLPIQGATVDVSGLRSQTNYLLSSWANQGLFSYGGRALPSLKAFLAVNSDHESVEETFVGIKYPQTSITLNIANQETMPQVYPVTGSQGRFIERPIVWNSENLPQLEQLGSGYSVHGTTEGFAVSANVTVIQNFVRDDSYENQGEVVSSPWQAIWSPSDSNVVKVERKNNPHSGRANLNWWNNGPFEVTVQQTITGLENGTYRLSMFIQGENATKGPYEELYLFVRNYGGDEKRANIVLTGWMKWENPTIEFTVTNGSALIGVYAKANNETWAHVDDWVLIKIGD